MKFNNNVLSLGAIVAALCISNAGVADARAVARRQFDEIVSPLVDMIDADPEGEGEGEGEGEQSEQDQQLAGWGLVRADDGDETAPLGAFSGSPEFGGVSWQRFTINPTEENMDKYKGHLSDEAVLVYNVIVNGDGSGAFDVRFVETEDRNLPGDARRRNLIKNGFTNAGGDMTKLKVVGDTDITEEGVRESIMSALEKKGIKPEEGDSDDSDMDDEVEYEDQAVTFEVDGDGWGEITDNVFVGGLTSMFGETDGMNGHRITEVVVTIRDGSVFDMRSTISGP